MAADASNHIVWMDTELTGLDINNSVILEVACTITDENLNIVSDGFNVVIYQPDSVLQNMDSWCTVTHAKTGLLQECKDSKITVQDAELMLLEFLQKYVPKGQCPLAGNTIYMDRVFLKKYMPQVDAYLHYRVIDVSSIKELVRRWTPKLYEYIPEKSLHHRAVADIKESIEELAYYRKHIFTPLID